MEDNLFIVGNYKKCYNEILSINLPCTEILQSEGLIKHIEKRHPNCICYLDKIPEILEIPDYIGTNPKEPDSIELVKQLDKNILVAVKLDKKDEHLYVASLFDISNGKLERRINSGRLKKY